MLTLDRRPRVAVLFSRRCPLQTGWGPLLTSAIALVARERAPLRHAPIEIDDASAARVAAHARAFGASP